MLFIVEKINNTKPENSLILATPKNEMQVNSNVDPNNLVENISERSLESKESLISSTSIKEKLRNKQKDSVSKKDEDIQSESGGVSKDRTTLAIRNSTTMQTVPSQSGKKKEAKVL